MAMPPGLAETGCSHSQLGDGGEDIQGHLGSRHAQDQDVPLQKDTAEPGSGSFLLNSVVVSCCLISGVFSVQPAGEIAQQLGVVLGLLLSVSQSPVAARNHHLDGTGRREAVIPSPKTATAVRKMVVFPGKCSCSSLLIKKMESHHGKKSQAL